MRTYWLSFCDPERPESEQFLGACLVEVTDEDAATALTFITEHFPKHAPGAEWQAAAARKAHREGCNPGGQILQIDVTGHPMLRLYPLHKLLSMAEIEAIAPVVRLGDDQ